MKRQSAVLLLLIILQIVYSTPLVIAQKSTNEETGEPKIVHRGFPKFYKPFASIFRRVILGKSDKIVCYVADVSDLRLSSNEISSCSQNISPEAGFGKINVVTTVAHADDDLDILVYKYDVTAGKIIGKGKNVVWDLSEAPLGIYSITSSVNDGCGFCGNTETRKIEIIGCRDPRF